MPHITLPSHLPGITGLLEYRQDTAQPIRELTQLLLRGSHTLTEGERELIATVVSHNNGCKFCTAAHTSAANILLGNAETCELIKHDLENAPVSNKMKALLHIAKMTQKSGKSVTEEAIQLAKNEGASDREIHDTVLIAALFCFYNKYVDGLATVAPIDNDFYDKLGERITTVGYLRLPECYDHLKK